MRIDKFLNAVNITKRRAISEDMCKSGVVAVNGAVVKPAKELKIGDVITISFLDRKQSFKVLAFPSAKNTPKNEQAKYVQEL
ncbi:S4 domain-containing protein [uncultured Campylobacter sp.]|uniref:S4 domain-containing protein n=1 Tax=uncultured Campylobacter sp. TaxID=218934 RepID=UPI0026132A86|nr:S4 domain-containing protein [uncultured Campylobacter sp.]